jgi:PAS domain S-box-containing protein
VKIVTRLTLVSLFSTLAMTLAVVGASVFVIDRMAHRSHERLLQLELVNAMRAVQQRLYADGVRAATREAEAQYRLLRGKEGFRTLSLFVVDRTDQRVVYHPDAPAGTQVRLPFVLDMLARQAGTGEYDYRDGPRMAVFQTLEHVNWLVGVSLSVSEIRAALPAFLETIGAIEFAALAFNALLLGLFGFWMMRRIGETARCIARIEQGELGARIDPGRSNDEIAELQRGVNAMGERIEQRTREQHAVRAELSESRAILRAVLDNAPALVSVRDLDERFILVNRRYEQVLGVREADILGRRLDDVFAPELAEQFRRKSSDALREGVPVRHEMMLTVDGEERCFLAQRYPLTGEDGRLTGVCGIASDITDLKRAETERQARREAEAASEAKSAFLATMSHELRTPLNAILGYAQILRGDRSLDERKLTQIETIHRSGEHLLALIEDILDVSRIEAGKLQLHAEPVDMDEFLLAIADVMELKAREKGLAFVLDAPTGQALAVEADERRLRQVLLNLIGNAVKFTERGQVILRARRLEEDQSRVRLRFEVEDSGIGIEPDELATLFQPFQQAAGVQRRYGGTGLGLSISRELVRLMGSELLVDSRRGSGSRFWFDLQLPRASRGTVLESRRAAQPIVGYAGERRRVLVVDDIEANRRLLVDMLSSLGFETDEAPDGEAALARAEAAPPQLVVMDSVMPVMDGLEATAQFRQRPALNRLPIIVVSASAAALDREASLAAGADAFLPKPVDIDRLLQEIGALLRLTWIRDASARAVPQAARAAGLVAPPAAEAETLYRLARTGNMRSISAHADRIEALGAPYGPLAQHLRALAERCQSRAILELATDFVKTGS